jgi:hypothetical protein
MSDKLGLYDYLGFIVPGAVIIAAVVYGFGLAGVTTAPSAEGIVLLTAAAFVIGHLNVAIANVLQPVAFGHRPFTRLRSTEGLFGDHGRYHEAEQKEIEDEFAEYFPAASTFEERFHLGYTLLRQKQLDSALQTANQQIGLYRNLMAATVVCLPLLAAAAATGHRTLRPQIWIPLDVLAAVLFAIRFRRFWVGFANEVIRGVRALKSPPKATSDPGDADRAGA